MVKDIDLPTDVTISRDTKVAFSLLWRIYDKLRASFVKIVSTEDALDQRLTVEDGPAGPSATALLANSVGEAHKARAEPRKQRRLIPRRLRLCGKSVKLELCREAEKYRVPVLLMITVVSYVALGAFVFHWLEDDNFGQPTRRTVKVLRRVAKLLNPACRGYLDQLIIFSQNGTLGSNVSIPRHIVDDEWHYKTAFLFAFSIVTTIGYGNLSPETTQGRAFCLVYSIVGIPLSYLGIAVVGRLFSEIVLNFYLKWRVWSHVKLPKLCGKEMGERPSKLPLHIIVAIFAMWIFAGSFMLPLWEPLSVFDSCYFVIISLTTIGLGDIYPGDYKYFAITYLYLTLGLVITAMLIDSLADYLRKIQYLGRVIKDFSSQYVQFGSEEIQVGRLISGVLRQLPMTEAEKAAAIMNVEGMLRAAVRFNNDPSHRLSLFGRFPWYGAVQPEALEYMGVNVGTLRFMDEEWFNSWSNYNTWLKEIYNVDSKGLSASISRETSNLNTETAQPSRSEITPTRAPSRTSRISLAPPVREKGIRRK